MRSLKTKLLAKVGLAVFVFFNFASVSGASNGATEAQKLEALGKFIKIAATYATAIERTWQSIVSSIF